MTRRIRSLASAPVLALLTATGLVTVAGPAAVRAAGHTDQPSELFTQDTFTTLRGFAAANHAAWFTFWSLNRDQPCPAGVQEPWAPGTCSNISQNGYDFTKIAAQYAG